MAKAETDILRGMRNALAYAKGNKSKGRVHRVEVPIVDVKSVHAKLGLSQERFATTFGVSVRTMRKWEQGDRRPTGAARVRLAVIDREPASVKRALAPGKYSTRCHRPLRTRNSTARIGARGVPIHGQAAAVDCTEALLAGLSHD